MSITTPDNINNKRFRSYDDPISMLDRGATMTVKNPTTLQKYLNIKTPATMSEMVGTTLDNHSYDNFNKKTTR